jgi:beta-catenin-like protein 1
MESEVELDEEIKKLHALATAPHLYPVLVSLNTVPSLLSLLSHENIDICVDVADLLNELTESDILSESRESLALIDALVPIESF